MRQFWEWSQVRPTMNLKADFIKWLRNGRYFNKLGISANVGWWYQRQRERKGNS